MFYATFAGSSNSSYNNTNIHSILCTRWISQEPSIRACVCVYAFLYINFHVYGCVCARLYFPFPSDVSDWHHIPSLSIIFHVHAYNVLRMAPNSLNIYDTMYGVGVASCMRVLVAIKWREKKHGVDMHTATACCIPAAAAVVAVVVSGDDETVFTSWTRGENRTGALNFARTLCHMEAFVHHFRRYSKQFIKFENHLFDQ